MSLQANKAIVGRYLAELVSKGDLSVAVDLLAPNLIFTSPYTPAPTRDRDTF